eukprot:746721-Hanusia_phi.AAC.1
MSPGRGGGVLPGAKQGVIHDRGGHFHSAQGGQDPAGDVESVKRRHGDPRTWAGDQRWEKMELDKMI